MRDRLRIIALKGKALLMFNEVSKEFEIQVNGNTVETALGYQDALNKMEEWK